MRDACRMAAPAFVRSVRTEHRLVRGLQRHAVERRDAFPGGLLELVGELSGIVGDQLGSVPRPADRHVERPLRGEFRVIRRHGSDDPVHHPALKRMHGRGPGAVEVPELGVAVGEFRH